MMARKDEISGPASLSVTITDAAIRLGLLAVLCYWSLKVMAPFLTIALWSAILTVALYPLFAWLARRLRRRWLAATLITLLCLVIVVGPVTWLGFSLIGSVGSLAGQLNAGQLPVPLPAETVKGWPLIGEHVYRLWTLAATNMKAALVEMAPHLRPIGAKLVGIAQGLGVGLLQFVASIVVAGFLFSPGPRLLDALRLVLHRVLSDRGEEAMQLAGATIRNVSRGVIGIALLQSLLAGAGFLAAGFPAAGFLAFVALLLGIIQIGPGVLLIPIAAWSWTAMETMNALIFTIYMVSVGLMDNVLRPILMARGLSTPMPVIMLGVIGGTIAYGIVGLFLGPIVLSVAWALIGAWVRDRDVAAEKTAPRDATALQGDIPGVPAALFPEGTTN
jgi:predicted PurR-regulated permease PerM